MKKTGENKLRLIVPGEDEKKRWDALVSTSPAGNVYSFSWYLDTVAPGRWGIITDEGLTLGLPVAFKKRTGYHNLYQPFYTMFFNVLGPAGLEETVTAVARQFHHIHLTTESEPGRLRHRLRKRQELLLENFSSEVYSENALRQIKKAEKNGLTFSFHENAHEVVQLFRDNKGAELKEYKTTEFKTLERLIEVSLQKKHGTCAQVRSNNTVLASAFFLTFGHRIIFLKGGVNEEGKNKGAMYYLMHHMLEWSRGHYEVFDFGGSNNNNVAEFYRRLGGKDVQYYEVMIDQRNVLHKLIGKLKK